MEPSPPVPNDEGLISSASDDVVLVVPRNAVVTIVGALEVMAGLGMALLALGWTAVIVVVAGFSHCGESRECWDPGPALAAGVAGVAAGGGLVVLGVGVVSRWAFAYWMSLGLAVMVCVLGAATIALTDNGAAPLRLVVGGAAGLAALLLLLPSSRADVARHRRARPLRGPQD